MKIAFCFAGQGAQAVGMGRDFYDKYESVKALYDANPEIKELCFEDKAGVLNQTAYAQKAMLLTSYAIASCIRENGIEQILLVAYLLVNIVLLHLRMYGILKMHLIL